MAQADHEGSRERIKAMKTQSSHRYALRRATFLLGILTCGLVSQAQAATVTETIDSPGSNTWRAPSGVNQVTVEVWGGGGRGGSRTSNGLAGGAGVFAAAAFFRHRAAREALKRCAEPV